MSLKKRKKHYLKVSLGNYPAAIRLADLLGDVCAIKSLKKDLNNLQ